MCYVQHQLLVCKDNLYRPLYNSPRLFLTQRMACVIQNSIAQACQVEFSCELNIVIYCSTDCFHPLPYNVSECEGWLTMLSCCMYCVHQKSGRICSPYILLSHIHHSSVYCLFINIVLVPVYSDIVRGNRRYTYL